MAASWCNGLSVFSLTLPLPLQGFHEGNKDFIYIIGIPRRKP